MGNKHTGDVSYYQPQNLTDLPNAIMELGYTADDITDVVLTHLHFDHCGYATCIDDKNEIKPTFPKAKYWLSKKQWELYENPNRLEIDSIFPENIQPVMDANLLRLVDEDSLLCKGFELRLFDGHSAGQLVPYISTNEGIYSFPGDLIPTSAHIPPEWISAYDTCALTSLAEKERFLAEAEKNGYTLIFCHDYKVKKGKVKKLNDNYKVRDTSL